MFFSIVIQVRYESSTLLFFKQPKFKLNDNKDTEFFLRIHQMHNNSLSSVLRER